LETERISLAKAYEKEQAQTRKKAEDDNKKALILQVEEKTRLKEIEKQKEIDNEKKENDRYINMY
jgi:hypothetical protein